LPVGSVLKFAGQPTNYLVTAGLASVATGGAITISPPLRAAIPAVATAITCACTIYKLLASGQEQATISGHDGGEAVDGVNARGVLKKIMININDFSKADFMILAKPAAVPVRDENPPDTNLAAFNPAIVVDTDSAEVLVGGFELNMTKLEIDTNANVGLIEGSRESVSRMTEFYKPTGTLTVTKELRSDWNPETFALAETAMDIVTRVIGGNECMVTWLRAAQVGIPTKTDIDGIVGWDIPISVQGTNTTDCLSFTFAAA
jgi:hypothetical protein